MSSSPASSNAADKYPDLKHRMDYELAHTKRGCASDCNKAVIYRKYNELGLERDRKRKPVL